MKIPEIRISLSDTLYWGESHTIYETWTKPQDRDKYPLITYEECKNLEKMYRSAWVENESKILKAMQDIVGVEFYRSVIDVSLAPMFTANSQPLIMSLRYTPDEFVDVLTHELFHVLYTDNKVISNRGKETDLFGRWQKMYGKKYSYLTLVHIPVHAGCKYIYEDVLKEPNRTLRDIDDIKSWSSDAKNDYQYSWEYVQKNDYKMILTELMEMYEDIKQDRRG